jgi:hypothetical protein
MFLGTEVIIFDPLPSRSFSRVYEGWIRRPVARYSVKTTITSLVRLKNIIPPASLS